MNSIPRPALLRKLARILPTLACGAALGLAAPAFASPDEVVMYKDPNCGCCGKWAEHMRSAGFAVKEVASARMELVKQEAGVPEALGSCHTAKVGGYVVEGHVPAADVRRMLAEKPAIRGLSAPGMPLGSPGMEGPYPAERYDVVSFDAQGRSAVFSKH
ncbi:MAG: DUF411 domain-containing protein [Thauera sp.]|uniref:DUF411 domain-containing protein n=1 Tax=Thauera sp. TaxID=1905334 RepID=UPI00260F8921|nr:DUF411 domain-containing protein [Thauera sp.]MCP5224327.1 DUF411 domain-containing protein [Thauera sp.]